MGWQIIKQPNNNYCIFSSIVDNVIYYNMTQLELINIFNKEINADISEKIIKIVKKLNNGEKPYHQFTKTYEDMLILIKEIHGEESMKEVQEMIEN